MMRNLLNGLLILTIILIANSCAKDPLDTEISTPPTIDHSKDFLKELTINRSDRFSPNFIHGEFDGKLVYFTTISSAYANYDIAWNGIFITQNGLDQINLIRQTSKDSVELAIYINDAKILSRQLPYDLNDGGRAEVELINRKKMKSAANGSSADAYFIADNYNGIKFRVTSFVDNILEGTFEGSLKSSSGSVITVKNGKFHVKVKLDIS